MRLLRLDDLLTADDAAVLCGVKANTIRAWVSRGILPVTAAQSRRNLFQAKDVAEADRLTRSRSSRARQREK